MIRKVLLLLACLLGLPSYAERQMCVVISDAQGRTTFRMAERPVVSFTDADVKMVCGNTEVLFPLTEDLRLTIEETDVETLIEQATDGTFTLTPYAITAQGCDGLSLYSTDGKLLATTTASADGTASLSLRQWPRGTYIVKTGNKAFKIAKK